MNTVWSDHVQGVKSLYLSRRLRFADRFASKYKSIFNLDEDRPLKILEVGCGPGALAQSLQAWYPQAEVTGLDLDSNFIAFARDRVPGVHFIEGDATSLPFEDESFDVTISYTVSDHVDPDSFFSEQARVLKTGGVCLCLSTVRTISQQAECMDRTPEERKFWLTLYQATDFRTTSFVGSHRLDERQLPLKMENQGFEPLASHIYVLDLTPDNPDCPPEMAEAMIQAKRESDLEILDIYRDQLDFTGMEDLGEEDFDRMVDRIQDHYDQRLALYRAGKKQWDRKIIIDQAGRGVKVR